MDRLRALVAAYGSDLGRFPEGEREAARALVRESAEARALVEAEAGLDERLARVAAPDLPADLRRRLLEIPIRAPRPKAWPFATRWVPALSWATAAAVGVWLGTLLPDDEGAIAAEPAVDVAGGTSGEPSADVEDETLEEELLEIAAGAYADDWGAP
jgi:hypothetical protein